MSVDGARDLNVFFSSPRVGFGETPPATSATTSLLTFADMVLALDRQNISDHFEFQSLDYNAESDHTYASSGYSRTRSQAAKAAAAQHTGRFSEHKHHGHDDDTNNEDNDRLKDDVNNIHSSISVGTQTSSSRYLQRSCEGNSKHFKGKRCSSVENICIAEPGPLTVNTSSRVCEWPEVVPKSSPRKSSSFEEVSCDNAKSCLKSSKSSEHVQKTGISYTLHRFVNNTLEFPCWPRKADHTYATATWDGTAASHNLLDHELRQDSTRQNIIEDQEMEDIDNCYPLQNRCDQLPVTTDQLHNFASLIQKDDHTYVKANFPYLSSPENIDTKTFNLDTDTDTLRTQAFSSATFPRQKMREDHTYFHSGLSRRSIGNAGGREWASTQTVASSLTPHDSYAEEAYRNLNSVSQNTSAKRDHNYSTSG